MDNSIEKRVEKIESCLMFEQGNFWWEIFTVLLKYCAFFFFGYILLVSIWSTMTVTLMEQLPAYCDSIK